MFGASINTLQPHMQEQATTRTMTALTIKRVVTHRKQVLQGFSFVVDHGRQKALQNHPIFAVLNDGNVRWLGADVQQVVALFIVDLQVADTHGAG